MDGDIVELSSLQGKARAKAQFSDMQKPGQAFLPMHWSGDFAAKASAGFVSSPSIDAISGQPELKHTPVAIRRIDVRWEAMLLSRRDIRPTGFLHWSRRAVEGGWLYSFYGPETPAQGAMLARTVFAGGEPEAGIQYIDRSAATYRAARLDASGAMSEALLVAPPRRLPDPDWLLALLASRAPLSPAERQALLSARTAVPTPSRGRIVCACFNVGENQIVAAIADGCASVEAVGARISAGTNCGSCRSEIRTFVDAAHLQAAE
jgi:assimilatory nitrate reductase catalytic subunit